MLLHQTAFPHWVLHQKPFAPEAFWHQKLLHRAPLHHATFTPEGVYSRIFYKEFLQQNPLKPAALPPKGLLYTCEGFYTKRVFTTEYVDTRNLLHPKELHTRRLLHQMHFTPKSFCTGRPSARGAQLCSSPKIFLHPQAFAWHLGALTAESIYSRNHFRQRAATPWHFTPKKFSIRRRYTAKRDLGLQNTKTLYTQTSATVQLCHPGLQNSRRTAPLWIAKHIKTQ